MAKRDQLFHVHRHDDPDRKLADYDRSIQKSTGTKRATDDHAGRQEPAEAGFCPVMKDKTRMSCTTSKFNLAKTYPDITSYREFIGSSQCCLLPVT